MTGRSMLRRTADGKVEDKTRMEEEESSLLDSLLEEACRSTNGLFVAAFFCQKTQCVLSISTKIHTFPPRVLSASSWARTWIGPLPLLLCFKVIQGLQFEKQNETQVHFGPKFCVLVFLEFHHWAALERHYASAAVIGDLCEATSHWQDECLRQKWSE